MIPTTMTIGLTGNIATGKSVVRRMLANSGLLELDADVIAHRMIYPQGPAYQSVLENFGNHILDADRTISRKNLGEIVFNQPDNLKNLEALIHPWVKKAILMRMDQSILPMTVIEAIKLLESSLGKHCQFLWVSQASETSQLDRLMSERKLTKKEARSRVETQPPQSEKISRADHVINTEREFKSTWNSVQAALNDTIQVNMGTSFEKIKTIDQQVPGDLHKISLTHLEDFWVSHTGEDAEKLYQSLAMKTLTPVVENDHIIALLVWRNWNFTGTLQHVIIDEKSGKNTELILNTFEEHARLQQSEMLILSDHVIQNNAFDPAQYGYVKTAADQITYPAWREAVECQASDGLTVTWIKVLSQPVEIAASMSLNPGINA